MIACGFLKGKNEKEQRKLADEEKYSLLTGKC